MVTLGLSKMCGRISLENRISRDRGNGDYGTALQRLLSHMASKGYDADLLAQAGQIAYEMHDLRQAGRLWLTSSAEGEHVDRAIEVALGKRRRDPRNTVSQLPRAARLPRVENYHPVARERVVRLGLQESILWKDQNRPKPKPMGRLALAVVGIVGVVAALVALTCFIAGSVALYDSLFG